MSKDLKIIFLGTPDFAVESLRALVQADFNIVAVITAPDRPMGRGKKLGESAVKKYAVAEKLPVLQPTNLKSEIFFEELRAYEADLQIVVAFRMLPEVIWNMPRLGTFNLHASLLPNYRGAAPINWAIINGEKQTGVTTFFLKHEIDTGEILFQETESIESNDTAGSLHDRLMMKGAALVVKTAKAIQEGDYASRPQTPGGDIKAAPKIFKEDCKIDWQRPKSQIRDFVRGLSPYPTAWTILDGKVLKVFEVREANNPARPAAGIFETDGKTYLRVSVNDGILEIVDLQIEGKRRMTIDEFLRGYQPKLQD